MVFAFRIETECRQAFVRTLHAKRRAEAARAAKADCETDFRKRKFTSKFAGSIGRVEFQSELLVRDSAHDFR